LPSPWWAGNVALLGHSIDVGAQKTHRWAGIGV